MDRRELLDDDEETTRTGHDAHQAKIWTAIPGIIESVNLGAMTVSVQPSVKGMVTDDQGNVTYPTLPLLDDVPIMFPSAGGFTLTFPVKAGDECLVMFSSRCIDAWWQSGGVGNPIDPRMHDLSDGFAFIGPRSQARLVGDISSANAQLRADAGTTFLEVTPDGKVNISAPTSMTIDTPIVFITGQIQNIPGSHSTGNYDAAFTGNIRATEDIVSSYGGGNISLNTHVHSGVQTGSGDTGEPVG